MRTHRTIALLSAATFACVVLPAGAADRVHAGQWAGTTTFDGTARASSTCIAQSDANAMNGDAESIRVYLDKVIPPTICTLKDIKVDGDQVTYTSVCGGVANTVATTYHGDSFESTNTRGAKTEAKRVGACK
ncbi:hypothetical protein GCM10009105_10500 [Dokdonella soli]|uniref:DUF3617 family protein n=2 Tax=Dokdonella soli TaxID=529810 RepID=A0ABN1IE04_9GAMM